jgi:hypothetical protein
MAGSILKERRGFSERNMTKIELFLNRYGLWVQLNSRVFLQKGHA